MCWLVPGNPNRSTRRSREYPGTFAPLTRPSHAVPIPEHTDTEKGKKMKRGEKRKERKLTVSPTSQSGSESQEVSHPNPQPPHYNPHQAR